MKEIEKVLHSCAKCPYKAEKVSHCSESNCKIKIFCFKICFGWSLLKFNFLLSSSEQLEEKKSFWSCDKIMVEILT